MKKIIINLFFLIFFVFTALIFILSTFGIETNKFNNLIAQKVYQNNNVELKLKTIKFKLDLKELSLFLETFNPRINYRKIIIPVQNVKVYVDFIPLIKSDIKIKKTIISLKELDIIQLNKLSAIIKPSNIKSILNNKIKEGKLVSDIEIFFTDDGRLNDFIAKGKIIGLEAELFNGLKLTKTNLGFFADKEDILFKNIFGFIGETKISDGDIKLNLQNGINISSNFNSKFDYDENSLKKFPKVINKINFINNIKKVKADLNNIIFIELDNTYKIKNYNYKISGKLQKGEIKLIKKIKNNFINEEIKKIYFSDLQVSSSFKPKSINFKGKGNYSLNKVNFYKIDFENNSKNDQIKINLNFNFGNNFKLNLINYTKPDNSIANVVVSLGKKNKDIKINSLSYKEGKNIININDLVFKENKVSSLKKINIKTENNDFFIKNDNNILIKGNRFDATNLIKFFSNQSDNNIFDEINSDIKIDFKNIKVPMSEKLKNFKLIGVIEKGKFMKISSKGDFGGNNFLDISMKKNKTNSKKYLEIYSDLTKPLLTEYSFFNGLSGGKLLFTSIIDDEISNSKLKIENFKVVNAPGMIKLLSLADLGGLVDLAEGEGLSFEVLEIDMEKNKNFLKINEILALGPSITVLMEGYKDESGVTSLRGTLVPAKTLNKLISKIPVIGNIVIPKEVGEGLFGISFKMKGPNGKIKTTINPIRTLTPRFIQKIIERNKISK